MSARRTGFLFHSDSTSKFHPLHPSRTHPLAFQREVPASHLQQFHPQSDARESDCRGAAEARDRGYADLCDTHRTHAHAAAPGRLLPEAGEPAPSEVGPRKVYSPNGRQLLSSANPLFTTLTGVCLIIFEHVLHKLKRSEFHLKQWLILLQCRLGN